MTERHAADWEALARREPYFAVLDSDGTPQVGGSGRASANFFETGEADVALLLSTIAALLGGDPPLGNVLDFGCGAGRLTLPLARRATQVVACDVAPTMLVHARQNADDAGLRNLALMESHELDTLPDGRFDLICSILVLQYIPPTVGYAIIRTLLRVLAASGVAALHIPFAPRGGALRRLARVVAGRSKVGPRIPPATPPPAQPMATYQYDELTVRRDLEAADVRLLGRFTARIGDADGTVLVAQKR